MTLVLSTASTGLYTDWHVHDLVIVMDLNHWGSGEVIRSMRETYYHLNGGTVWSCFINPTSLLSFISDVVFASLPE